MSPALQAEQLVLGALLHGNPVTGCAADRLTAEAFTYPDHRDLYWRLVAGHLQLEDAADLVAVLGAGHSIAAPLRIGRTPA